MADTAVVALHGATLDTMQATPDDGSASLVLPVITAAVALSGFGAHIPIGECEVYLEILHDELGYVYLRSEGQDVSVVDGRASGSDDTTMVLFAGLAVWLPQRHVRTIASLHAAGDVAVRFMYPLHASPPGAASMQSPMSSRRRCRIVVDTGSRKIASQPVVLQMLGAAEQWHALDTQSTSPVDPRSFYDALAPSLLPPPVQR